MYTARKYRVCLCIQRKSQALFRCTQITDKLDIYDVAVTLQACFKQPVSSKYNALHLEDNNARLPLPHKKNPSN